jgi:hypothetical protein
MAGVTRDVVRIVVANDAGVYKPSSQSVRLA